MINHLVTINILSFNRKDELQHTLLKVFEQDYKNIEVIVVDNASSDGTQEMIKNQFPEVNLIQLSKNIGIAGWNKGFEIAKGEYVLVLDDDSYPGKNSIESGLEKIIDDDKIGIIAYNILNKRTNEFEKIGFNDKKPLMFIGCGGLIRKELIIKIGGFNEKIFIYNHEQDFSIKCYNQNYIIYLLEENYIIHAQSKLRPESEKNAYKTEFRYVNYYISLSYFILENFSIKYSWIYFIKWILNRFIIAITHNYILSFTKTTIQLILEFRKIIKCQNVIKFEVQKFYGFGNHPLIDRDYFPNFRNPFK